MMVKEMARLSGIVRRDRGHGFDVKSWPGFELCTSQIRNTSCDHFATYFAELETPCH
jgi:hypothetical protein